MTKLLPVVSLCAALSAAALLACAADPSPVVGTPFERREIVDALGRTVTFYVSHPKKSPAPVLLMVQGSGCAKVLNEQGASSYSTLFNLVPYAEEGEFTVVAVEKPFAGEADRRNSGTALSCSPKFNSDFTADRWLVAIRAALEDARKSPWVDTRRTLVFGISEGAVMADMLAGRDSSITDVVSIGGPGTTQLFSFVADAYEHCPDPAECLADIHRKFQDIEADPESSTRFAWGHPFKRWSSFFRIDPGEELLRSKARVYIAFGTKDRATPPLSEEIAVAKLELAGRDLTVRRVAGAGHSLANETHPDYRDVDKEFRSALNWFWQGSASLKAADNKK
jgi:pimeloyl-ACP methyl ester carboxylesterase